MAENSRIKLKFIFIIRTMNNDNTIVLKVCEEIIATFPESIMPDFERGKHLQFKEALLKLPEKLGISKIIKYFHFYY